MERLETRKFHELKLYLKRTECPDAREFARHCHAHYELLHLVRGRGKFVVESAEYPLREGMVLLLKPYEYHYVQPEEDCLYERVVLNFSADALSSAAAALPLLNGGAGEAGACFFAEDLPAGVAAALGTLEHCENMPAQEAQALTQAVLEQVLLLLNLAKPAGAVATDPLMEQVMTYLSENLHREISLDELSAQFFLSKYHLCRAFRKHAGVTVLDYLTQKRIAMAQTLLSQGLSASEAARKTGFGEYSTFYRAYRKRMGCSPTSRQSKV